MKKSITRRACLLAGIGLLTVSMAVAQASGILVTTTVKDSQQVGIPGVVVRYSNNSFRTWTSVKTDDNGVATVYLPAGAWQIRAIYQGTSSATLTQYVGTDPDWTLYTSESRVVVQDCYGRPIAGARVRFFYDGTLGTWVSVISNANGEATTELFPGSHVVGATINDTTSEDQTYMLAGDSVTAGQSTTTVFTPTKVTILGASPIQYWIGNPAKGYWSRSDAIASPFYMFPATVKFRLGGVGGMVVDLEISDDCEMVGALLQLKDASGNGLAGGVARPACGGSWEPTLPGETDATGKLFAQLPPCFTKIKMVVNQSSQEKSKAQLAADGYTWQTSTATINVKHWDGSPFAGVVIDQGGQDWDEGIAKTDASGVARVPMFPGSSGTFRANWNNTSQTIKQTVPSTFVFQTGLVRSTSGKCTTWSNGKKWISFIQDMEVFPGTYTFKFSDGTPQTQYTISAGVVNHIH